MNSHTLVSMLTSSRHVHVPIFRGEFESKRVKLQTVTQEVNEQFVLLLERTKQTTAEARMTAVSTFASLAAIRLIGMLQRFHGRLVTSSSDIVLNLFPDLPPVPPSLLRLLPFVSVTGSLAFGQERFLGCRVGPNENSYESILMPRSDAERLQDAAPDEDAYYRWILPQWLLWNYKRPVPEPTGWHVFVLWDEYGRERYVDSDPTPWQGEDLEREEGHQWLKSGKNRVKEVELKPGWFVWILNLK